MKTNKRLMIAGLLTLCAALLAAEDLDGIVKAAVDGMASRVIYRREVVIEGVFPAGTQTPTALTRSLSFRIANYAVQSGKFAVVEPSRSISRVNGGTEKAVIKGEFMQEGDMVQVTLQLVTDPGGMVLDARSFTIPMEELKRLNISILPDNVTTPEAIKEKEEVVVAPEPPAPTPPVSADFTIKAWPNAETATYIEGEQMTVYLLASKDCYVKVYHVDAEGAMKLLFPNRYNKDNFLKANTEYVVPKKPVSIVVEKPLGMESIWVQASGKPFENLEKEYVEVRNASVETVQTMRGVRLDMDSAETGIAETSFTITTLEADYFDEAYSYPKPADMAGTLRSMRSEIRKQGGTFKGDEQEGTFTANGTSGTYRVSGSTVTVKLRYTGVRLAASASRSAGAAFTFSIDKPRDIGRAVQTVRRGIEGKGGTFNGDERQGSFRASGISGQYSITDKVGVSINEKPPLIPNALIEKEVKNYFSGK
jgi:hypothetical protein